MVNEEILALLLVKDDGEPREHYDLCHLPISKEGAEDEVFDLIPIVVSDKRLLVAAPEEAWSVTPKERRLGTRALVRPMRVEVTGAFLSAPGELLELKEVVVWVGLLDNRLAKKLVKGPALRPAASVWKVEEGAGSIEERTLIPFGPALKDIAEEHFVFQSAPSGTGEQSGGGDVTGTRGAAEKKEPTVEERLQRMEEMIQQMSINFAMKESQPEKEVRTAAPPAGRLFVGAPKKKPAVQAPKEELGGADLEGLDPTVVAASVDAGIPAGQLKHLGTLLKKTNRMEDAVAGQRSKPVQKNLLSETEDEENEAEEVEAEEEPEQAGAVAQAVVKLTKIVEDLSKKRQNARDLDTLLDHAEGGSELSSSSSSSKSKAAAYKKLREALTKHPEIIAQTIEELMSQDFGQIQAAPGSGSRDVSTRAWIEHRSKLQHYVGSIRQAWVLGGIHDAMRKKNWQEARARTLLGIMALDQASLDSGSWTLAQEVYLEAPAPYSSFRERKLPDPWEQTVSRLMDDRWSEVLMWKIKDKDSFIEARKRLGNAKGGGKSDPSANLNPDKPNPKAAAKKGAKGDGKSRRENQEEAAQAAH